MELHEPRSSKRRSGFISGGPDHCTASADAPSRIRRSHQLLIDIRWAVIWSLAAQCVLAAQTNSRADEYASRAQAEIATNQPEAAAADLNQLLKLRPNDVNGLASLGMVEFTRGRYAEAEVQFRRALTLSPSLWDA